MKLGCGHVIRGPSKPRTHRYVGCCAYCGRPTYACYVFHRKCYGEDVLLGQERRSAQGAEAEINALCGQRWECEGAERRRVEERLQYLERREANRMAAYYEAHSPLKRGAGDAALARADALLAAVTAE